MIKENILYPFIINKSHIIGKICDISEIVNEIMQMHEYKSELQEEILVRFIIIATLIGQTLKEDNKRISIQLQGSSGINLIVIDYIFPGKIRGYIDYNKDMAVGKNSFLELTKDAILVINIQDNITLSNYQSQIKINYDSIDANFEEYFNLSEQINTKLLTSCTKENGRWKARGIFIQQLPNQYIEDEDSFNRVNMFINSLTSTEFLYSNLELTEILYRLFHEEDIQIYDYAEIKRYCSCDRELLLNLLMSMPPESLLESSDNGRIEIKCEFCNNKQVFLFNEIFKGN